jgi:hypothetical protein
VLFETVTIDFGVDDLGVDPTRVLRFLEKDTRNGLPSDVAAGVLVEHATDAFTAQYSQPGEKTAMRTRLLTCAGDNTGKTEGCCLDVGVDCSR